MSGGVRFSISLDKVTNDRLEAEVESRSPKVSKSYVVSEAIIQFLDERSRLKQLSLDLKENGQG